MFAVILAVDCVALTLRVQAAELPDTVTVGE